MLERPHVGTLFLIPGRGDTLRINGTARILSDAEYFDAMAVRGRPPLLALEIDIEEVFFHCAKAFIRSQLWQPESWSDRYKISFSKMLGAKAGWDGTMIEQMDRAIEQDYKTNL